VHLAVIALVFGLIFLAELPDKTALASLVLGTRYRPLYVWTGAAAAFLVHVSLAVALGSLLTLLPHRLLEAIVGVLFLVGAVLLLRGRRSTTTRSASASARSSGCGRWRRWPSRAAAACSGWSRSA